MTHTINVELARKVLAQIMAAPTRWRQAMWLDRPYLPDEQSAEDTVDNCETSGCFAGWSVVLAGYKTGRIEGVLDIPEDTRVQIAGAQDDDRHLMQPSIPSVRAVAAYELGLDADQALALFEATNSLVDLYELLEAWTEGEITAPDALPEWAEMGGGELEDYFAPDDEEDEPA